MAIASRATRVAKVDLATTTTAGGIFSWTAGRAAIITRVIVNITTPGPGATTMDVGVAANATTLSDTLIDGVATSAAGIFDNVENKGTNGLSRRALSATQYVTGSSVGAAAMTGLVGAVYIHWIVQ